MAAPRALKPSRRSDGSAADYYLDLAGRDISDYYTGAGEAPGVALGAGWAALADHLGVTVEAGDTLDAERAGAFRWLLSRDVRTTLFPAHRRGGDADHDIVTAYDATFCAPKSLSILAAVTRDDDLRRRIYEAHDAAVRRVVAALEPEWSWCREGKRGETVLQSPGLVAAAFRHRLARPVEPNEPAPDPHLHTHVVVANLAQHPDGSWGTLDARAIYNWTKAAGALYRAELIGQLAARGLAFEWRRAEHNTLEVEGIPRQVLAAFSRRHEDLVAEAERIGQTSAAGLATAQRRTRKAKDREVAAPSDQALADRLRARLAGVTVGRGRSARAVTVEELEGLVRPARVADPARPGDLEAAQEAASRPLGVTPVGEGTPHLTAFRSTFTRPEAVAAVADQLVLEDGRHASAADLLAATDRLLADGERTVRLAVSTPEAALADADPERARRARLALNRAWTARYTTPEIVRIEQRLLDLARSGASAGAGVVRPEALAAVLSRHPHLSDEQRSAVEHLTRGGHRVAVVIGAAGSGKTTLLRAAREAWEAEGRLVVGAALAARAAHEMEDAGVRSETLHRLVGELRDSGERLRPGTVVVVDEAATAATRLLDQVRRAVEATPGAQLVLVGDHRQLSAVEAGGAFRLLVEQAPETVCTLTENRRQQDPEEARRLAELREGGAVRSVVSAWREQGRVHLAPDRLQALAACVEGWWQDRCQGLDTRMLADRRVDVALLNGLARARLVEAGEVREGVEDPASGLRFGVGDRIMATRNDPRFDVRNGDLGTVVRVEQEGGGLALTVVSDDEKSVWRLPPEYVSASVDYGYATTTTKAQGATCDSAHVLAGDTTSREGTYVAASRARGRTDFYAPAPDLADPDPVVDAVAVVDERSPLDAWVEAASRRVEELAASLYGVAEPSGPTEPEPEPEPETEPERRGAGDWWTDRDGLDRDAGPSLEREP
jgi:conjugative relaxase-like TrwC/TraI family protein